MNPKNPQLIEEATYQCPVCGHGLPYEPPVPRLDAPCAECGYHIWCRRRLPSDDPLLEVLPGRTPEPWDVGQVVETLLRESAGKCVVVDLARLDVVDSAFVARLLAMHKRLRTVGRRLVLVGLCPVVREMFTHLRLDRAFEISQDAELPAAEPA